jgi:hypothetical protein
VLQLASIADVFVKKPIVASLNVCFRLYGHQEHVDSWHCLSSPKQAGTVMGGHESHSYYLLPVCLSHRYVIRQMVGIYGYYTAVDIGFASGDAAANQFGIGLSVLHMSHERAEPRTKYSTNFYTVETIRSRNQEICDMSNIMCTLYS